MPEFEAPLASPMISPDSSFKDDLRSLRQGLDPRVLIICLVAAGVLTLQHYFAKYTVISGWLQPLVPPAQLEIWGSLSWCGSIVFLYWLLPMPVVTAVFKQSLSDYGLSFKVLRSHYQPYLILFGVMLVPLLLVASTPVFQQMYPFFKYVRHSWTLFLLWQVAYALQFVAVEFFFRGFLLFGLYPRLGAYTFFLNSIPYCMIHFSKPLGESLGAIVAGIVLSYLAYKSRSVWGGAALHWGVAVSMDLAAILL